MEEEEEEVMAFFFWLFSVFLFSLARRLGGGKGGCDVIG